ncbi:MAG: hypothetical protein KKA44_05410 [Alphaproteobacteria bacterium]|nr:hypothetical protein [Alphaproteobacteria bacterium]MBU0865596.1 hypothetical protein [Alphaproteobacteria bacterium]MBU1824399.1 hypothetical protein [Alphaproteobacteria bacterium]
MDPIEAQAALDSMNAAQREFAASGPKYPLWRHAAFAAVMAAVVLSQGFGPPLQILLFVFAMAAVAWLVVDDRRRYGVFVSGYRKGRTLPLTLALVALLLGTMGAEIYARVNDLSLAVKLGIAGGAFVVALAASLLWTRIYDRELQDGAA